MLDNLVLNKELKIAHRYLMNNLKAIPRKVWWGWERGSHLEVAQELPSFDDSLRHWIAIYAIYQLDFKNHRYHQFLEDARDSKYLVMEFTLPICILEARYSVDSHDCVEPDDVTLINTQALNSEEEINLYLDKHNINAELFTPPWRCDYPL